MRLAAAIALALFAGLAHADEALWTLLKGGGQVVMIRHGLTTPGVGDPPDMKLQDCASQRNMTEVGRRQAREVGEAFRSRGIPVGRVLSSPWCRCIETARIAFGKSETYVPLSNLFGRPENREKQVQDLAALVSRPVSGGNLILSTHGSTIAALTGVSPDTAEMVILTPQGKGKFAVAGRLVAHRAQGS